MATPPNILKPDLVVPCAFPIPSARIRPPAGVGSGSRSPSLLVGFAGRQRLPLFAIVKSKWKSPPPREPATGPAGVLNASGYVTPRQRATIAAKITGRVTGVFFDEGTRVTEGQLLATLDDSDVRRALDSAKADRDSSQAAILDYEVQLKNAEIELHRNQQLVKEGVQTQQALDTASHDRGQLAGEDCPGQATSGRRRRAHPRAAASRGQLHHSRAVRRHRGLKGRASRRNGLARFRRRRVSRAPASPPSSIFTPTNLKWMSANRTSPGSRTIKPSMRSSTLIPTGLFRPRSAR